MTTKQPHSVVSARKTTRMARIAVRLGATPGVVAYRHGAFTDMRRLRSDGIREPLVPDATGELVPDQRGVTFILPPGGTDPFAGDGAPEPPTQ